MVVVGGGRHFVHKGRAAREFDDDMLVGIPGNDQWVRGATRNRSVGKWTKIRSVS